MLKFSATPTLVSHVGLNSLSNRFSLTVISQPIKSTTPYAAPSERIIYIRTESLQAMLDMHKVIIAKDIQNQDIVNQHFKDWLALKELVKRTDSYADRTNFLIFIITSSLLVKYIAPSLFPPSQITGKTLGLLFLTIWTYFSFNFQHLTRKKEALESEIIQFENKYQFIVQRSENINIPNDLSHPFICEGYSIEDNSSLSSTIKNNSSRIRRKFSETSTPPTFQLMAN